MPLQTLYAPRSRSWSTTGTRFRAFIEPALQALVAIISSQWDQIRIVFDTALGVIKGVVDVFMGMFTATGTARGTA
jgi:hypothetical protein